MKTVGGNVRAMRERRGWAPEDLCARAAISIVTLADIECGDAVPSIDDCARIAMTLGVNMGDLFREVAAHTLIDTRLDRRAE